LLIVSAGNDVGNLVQNNVCPACLALPDMPRMENVPRRTIVVGAATETLGIAPGSGYGDNVVTLYAPGRPTGAVDIAGGDASGWSSATSYAAPQAAFAASLLRALGVEKYYEIKERLKESTWPLSDTLVSAPVGVLDMVRVAAVYRDVVEVTEIEGGTSVRKTYVGRILEPIDSLGLCSPRRPGGESLAAAARPGDGPLQGSGNPLHAGRKPHPSQPSARGRRFGVPAVAREPPAACLAKPLGPRRRRASRMTQSGTGSAGCGRAYGENRIST
jgi:hypothetical protein